MARKQNAETTKQLESEYRRRREHLQTLRSDRNAVLEQIRELRKHGRHMQTVGVAPDAANRAAAKERTDPPGQATAVLDDLASPAGLEREAQVLATAIEIQQKLLSEARREWSAVVCGEKLDDHKAHVGEIVNAGHVLLGAIADEVAFRAALPAGVKVEAPMADVRMIQSALELIKHAVNQYENAARAVGYVE